MNPQVTIIYLDEYHSHPIAIAESAFAEIERLVLAARVCRICGLPYTQETGNRPRVTQNICLACFLKKQRDTYTFVGKQDAEPGSRYTTYLYLDRRGMVHYSTTAHDDDPEESIEETLRYYGFPVPDSYTESGQHIKFYGGQWYIRGDVKTHSVVVIEFIRNIDDYRHIPFLTTKQGDVVFLDKRRGNTRRLYQTAKKQYEATTSKYNRWESGIYTLVSELASAEHDLNKKGDGQ